MTRRKRKAPSMPDIVMPTPERVAKGDLVSTGGQGKSEQRVSSVSALERLAAKGIIDAVQLRAGQLYYSYWYHGHRGLQAIDYGALHHVPDFFSFLPTTQRQAENNQHYYTAREAMLPRERAIYEAIVLHDQTVEQIADGCRLVYNDAKQQSAEVMTVLRMILDRQCADWGLGNKRRSGLARSV